MTPAIAALFLLTLQEPAGQPPADTAQLQLQMACAPTMLPAAPVTGIRIVGGEEHGRVMFGPGESVVINAGTSEGLKVGQEYFVRRAVQSQFAVEDAGFHLVSIHTAGWVTITDAEDHTSVASVTHSCDGIVEGDYLEPYVEPVIPTASNGGSPDFAHPGKILMADEQRQAGFPGLLMLIDRGSDQGVRAGQSITIFRHALDGHGPNITVGVALVLQTSPATALVRIDSANGPVYVGDLVAIHRLKP